MGVLYIYYNSYFSYYVKKIPLNKAKILFAKGNFWGRSLAACASSDDPYRYKDFGPFDMNFQLVEYNNIQSLEEALKADPNVFLSPTRSPLSCWSLFKGKTES
jgi:acetylornithine/succinyldiaminopimelate/putrescine aminotransferase